MHGFKLKHEVNFVHGFKVKHGVKYAWQLSDLHHGLSVMVQAAAALQVYSTSRVKVVK